METGYRVQQVFLEATAHELKTPLALLRAQIEMEGCDDRGTLLRDIDQIARQVHQLLHLAEVSEDRNYRVESTEVAAVAVNVVDYLRRLAERRNVYLDLCCTSAESKSVQADPAALHMLLKNVVENAIEHSPHGGVVAVVVESDQVTTVGYKSSGTSFRYRIAKGVSVGSYSGHSSAVKALTRTADGEFVVTTQRVIFAGDAKSFEIQLKRLTNIEPYSNGLGLHHGASTHTVVFDAPELADAMARVLKLAAEGKLKIASPTHNVALTVSATAGHPA